MHYLYMLQVGQNSHHIVEHLRDIYDQYCGCGPSPHPRVSPQTVFLEPFSFYHPGQENCMMDDASSLFDLSDTSFLDHMSVA